jgi:hypothetical protein
MTQKEHKYDHTALCKNTLRNQNLSWMTSKMVRKLAHFEEYWQNRFSRILTGAVVRLPENNITLLSLSRSRLQANDCIPEPGPARFMF